jgi:hypothetical protein
MSKTKPNAAGAFSEFIRNASVEEKTQVYSRVLERASAEQNAVLEKARKLKANSR